MHSLLDASSDDVRDAALRRVAAFVAPVAADAGSAVADAGALDIADAVYRAFGDLDADGGLTRAHLMAACADVSDAKVIDSRFDLSGSLGMPRPGPCATPPRPERQHHGLSSARRARPLYADPERRPGTRRRPTIPSDPHRPMPARQRETSHGRWFRSSGPSDRRRDKAVGYRGLPTRLPIRPGNFLRAGQRAGCRCWTVEPNRPR